MKPDDVPQWAWDEADDTTYNIETDGHGSIKYTEARVSIARLVMKARSQAFEELESALKAKKYLPSQGIDAEMEAFNDGLDEAIEAIRQHSQKGKDK